MNFERFVMLVSFGYIDSKALATVLESNSAARQTRCLIESIQDLNFRLEINSNLGWSLTNFNSVHIYSQKGARNQQNFQKSHFSKSTYSVFNLENQIRRRIYIKDTMSCDAIYLYKLYTIFVNIVLQRGMNNLRFIFDQ